MGRIQNKWVQISLFNLLVVSILGCVLRYKIAYSLPIVNQKYLLNAHSHFAFSGWVTMALMVLLIKYLEEKTGTRYFSRYKNILLLNLIAAYGMLFTFPFQGYALGSIIFSTLSIFTAYFFAYRYWKDIEIVPKPSIEVMFFKASLLFNVFSSIGVFGLAYMMATKNFNQNFYLAAVYMFLHFQYNGWFLFACMGLLAYKLYSLGVSYNALKVSFWLFAAACVPAYFLSALWLSIPIWVYPIILIAVIAQLLGWGVIISASLPRINAIKSSLSSFSLILFSLCGFAYTVKLLLQAASSIPSLSFLTYGFRPIVIGYLHLVLLGVISMFILSYCVAYQYMLINKWMKIGIVVFVLGVIVNELLLMIEGIADLKYKLVPYMNEGLLGAALWLFLGLLIINISVFSHTD